MRLKVYLSQMRPEHYLKNALIFLPLLFSGQLFSQGHSLKAIIGFLAFSLVASAVYTINDLKDKDLDRKHPQKRLRPIASGSITTRSANKLILLLLVIASTAHYLAGLPIASYMLLVIYLMVNIAYSYGLKNIPIVDISILSLGFVIRVLYGGLATGIDVSKWLYLAILAFSFYLGLGKRRNELRTTGSQTRKVNRHYNQEFLDKNMYVCLGLTVAYYSLWAIDPQQEHTLVFWTIPLVIVIVMAYSLAIESAGSNGDPVTVVLRSKHLLALIVIYGFLITYLVYI